MSDPETNSPQRGLDGPNRSGLRRWRWPLILGGPALILVAVGYFILTGGRYETTDNAYVQVAKAPVAPSIAGRVVEIYVHENQLVRRGQVLFKLDPRDFQAGAEAAEAQLANAELQVRAQRAAYQQQQANVRAAEEAVSYTAREASRQQQLAAAGVASRQQVDQAVHAAQQARDQLAGARQQAAQALASIGGDLSLAPARHPAVMQARAQLERAQLNVSYATVTAPADGVVARVDQMPVGTYLNASQTGFWLLSGQPWVEANFKEDQLAHMKVGQPVTIDVDAYPDGDLAGHVASFAPGTGSAFSALPAQNATGNWVKVTQRLPVRIAFDKPPPGMAGRAGLSAKVKVDVRAPARAPLTGTEMSAAQDEANRWPITISVMLATVMNSLDTTIANVALPHIQGSVQAGPEQIGWVLTSYIIAAAIMTPLSGWLAARFGRKRLFLISITGFVVASMLCGVATTLPELVVFRLAQGVFGASLIPLSQAVLLDINPPEKHGQAMAIWGAGAILGPILGPALGGYLTEYYSWRWCFYINLPIGILALLGVWIFISADRLEKAKRFDFLGFGMLTLFVGSFQLLLDRGPGEDWFSSTEIWTEAILAAIGLWVFVMHTLTAEHPFFDRALVRDRNFMTASVFGFFVGILLFSTMALLPPMMQVVLGYPVLTAGLVSMPRGLGSFVAMFVVGRLIGRVDTRLILLTGLTISCVALWQMMHFDLSMTPTPIIVSGIVQGFGIGLIFVPLSTLAFATVSPALRAEGSGVFTLVRNLGASVGISIMQALLVANTQTMHASLAGQVIPTDPVVRDGLPALFNPHTLAGLQALNAEITRQATMVAYVDDFKLMFIITIVCMPMLLLMRKPRRAGGEPIHAAVE